ncbi:ras gtpase-activating protein [Anaeramoeba flamelloides]|uniref:Ras gtpase-activating protein n=1 Tax=Anaeramoeba flamelloides TaxID=1746091 RepID=A0ABQ8Y861_9EUKA|nr:ras gtpase-activating protein [Anaeramoeba flamelloides]
MSVTPTKSGFSKNKIKKKKRSIDQDNTPVKKKKSKNRHRSRSTHTRSKIKNNTLDRKNSYNTPPKIKISNSNSNHHTYRKKNNKTPPTKFGTRFSPRVKNSSPTARIETIQNLRHFSDQFTPINEKKNKKSTSKMVSLFNQDKPYQIEKQSFKLVIWTINSSSALESEMSSQQFSTSSYSSKNSLSFLETNLPLLMYEEEEERYKIFRNFSLKQRSILINSLVNYLVSIELMKLISPIRITPKFSQMNTNLAELLRNALSKQKLNDFDPMLCKNVLIEIIKTIPNDTLLPIDFLTDILLDNDRSRFEDLKPFLKNKYQLSIWKDFVKYWKHCFEAKLDDITEISSIFGSAISNSTLNNPEKLSKYSEESVLSELTDLEQISDQESEIETEINFPIIEGNVLITTEKRRRRLLREEKLKRFIHNNTTNKNKTHPKNKKKKKKNRKDNKNNKSTEDDSLSDISSKINDENENIWIKIYLKLTPKRIEFYQTKNSELIGSLSLNTLKLYQKSHNVGDISRTGGKIQENEENSSNQKKDVGNDNGNDKNENLSNSSSILKNQSSIHETEPSQSEDHIFIIAENQIYNSVLINVGSKQQVNKWTSNILIRKRSIINDLPFISKMLSLKDHKNQILHSLLVSKNMSLVAAILENFDTRIHQNNFESGEAIARSLVISFHSKNRVLRLLRWMIFQETVNGKNNTRTLFRSSSLSAKLIPIFAHIVAHDFLVKTLSSTIEMVSKIKSHLEVDEDRVGKQMAEKNRNALILLTNEFLAKIILSARETPLPFRIICRAMKKAVSRVFPESSYKSLNNFLFLRFFVPAIATPEAFGIMEKKDIDITLRRNLVSISKLIQSVGNQSEGLKGTLSCLNGFVKQSATRILKYFEQIAEIPNDDKEWNFNSCPLPQNQVEEALVMLKNHITTNWQDIKDVLTHSDSRSNFSVFVSDYIENLITYKEGLKIWK